MSIVRPRQILVCEARDWVGRCHFQTDSFAVFTIWLRDSESRQSCLSQLSLRPESVALLARKVKRLQILTLIYVLTEQLLVVGIVLIRQAALARDLRVAKGFLGNGGIELSALVAHSFLEASGRFTFDSDSLVKSQSASSSHFLSYFV